MTQPAQIPVAVPSAEVHQLRARLAELELEIDALAKKRARFVDAFFRSSSGEPEPQRVGESSDFGRSINKDRDDDRPRKFWPFRTIEFSPLGP